jgi:hypothetical protein
MLIERWARVCIPLALLAGVSGFAQVSEAADDTARMYGSWTITFPYLGRTLTLVSVHDAGGYKNYVLLPDGSMPVGAGKFSAANGRWTAEAAKPNDTGTYQFIDADTFNATNSAGQSVTWKRYSGPLPPLIGTGANYPKNLNATMANAVATSRKVWMKDAVINSVQLQWYPPKVLDSMKTYWLKLSMVSPSARIVCTTNIGGPLNGNTLCSPPMDAARLQAPLPSSISVDLPDVLADVRHKGMAGPLGSVELRMAGATGKQQFPAWVIEVAGGPSWVPLFVNAQDGRVVGWQKAMDPPNGSDAQLAEVYGALLHRNHISGSSGDPGYEAAKCVFEIQEGGACTY